MHEHVNIYFVEDKKIDYNNKKEIIEREKKKNQR